MINWERDHRPPSELKKPNTRLLFTRINTFFNMEVTKNFAGFVNMVDMNYYEVYDFYQAAVGNEESQTTFRVLPANGAPEDILIIYNAYNDIIALRLTPTAKNYLPEWIEQNLMDGMDAESYWGMEHAKEKDEREDQ